MHLRAEPSMGRRNAAGYALLEALVAVVVASVGFIGAARMQTAGMALSNSAQSRQKATLLGYQMTDRIRANDLGFREGRYNDPATGSTSCLSSGCTPQQLATADMGEWLADVATLPGGTGKVCIDSTPNDGTALAPACDGTGNVIAVKIWWTDNWWTDNEVKTTRFVTLVRPL
ncbi:MAG: type IV pilus modification protein PilV [Burkholderiaceae bacterium]